MPIKVLKVNQKGFAHLLPILLILVVLAAVAYFLFLNKGKIDLPNITKDAKEPTVAIKTEYKNPFKKENQYVNPFDDYKSPFLSFGK